MSKSHRRRALCAAASAALFCLIAAPLPAHAKSKQRSAAAVRSWPQPQEPAPIAAPVAGPQSAKR